MASTGSIVRNSVTIQHNPENLARNSELPQNKIIKEGEKKRGRPKRLKARNFLERLKKFEEDTLRFMDNEIVPFTNNQGERDLRMTKVHQKISGCFRSSEGAKFFCRIRSYISTCGKKGLSANDALTLLFLGKDPDFMTADVNSSAYQQDCAE